MERFRKIAFIIEHSPNKGYYPFERASILASLLNKTASIYVFVKQANHDSIEKFISNQLTPIEFESYKQLLPTLKNLQLDLIVLDGEDSTIDLVKQLNNYCPTIVHFDDFGIGAKSSLFHFKALYEENIETVEQNEVTGPYFFIGSPFLKSIKHQRLLRTPSLPATNTPPHIAIYYEDGDQPNLTYRTLRHLTQLQIPLQISILLDDSYSHSTEDLSMMALSRKNIKIVRGEKAIEAILVNADCLICNNLYTPYKAAYINIPCITVASNERELKLAFGREHNGFIHIGLGRKMKQSHLQNAVMEFLLHEPIRKRALERQQKIGFDINENILSDLFIELAHQRYNISSLLK